MLRNGCQQPNHVHSSFYRHRKVVFRPRRLKRRHFDCKVRVRINQYKSRIDKDVCCSYCSCQLCVVRVDCSNQVCVCVCGRVRACVVHVGYHEILDCVFFISDLCVVRVVSFVYLLFQFLDEVVIEMETCEVPRDPQTTSPLTASG